MGQNWNPYLADVALNANNDTDNLPGLFLCPLTDRAITSLTGEQSRDYLQGQLTCDLQKLTDSSFLAGAHCDAKGKMWAIVKAFTVGEQFLLSGHTAEMEACRTQLQKYGVFAKTTITDASQQWFTFGLGGKEAVSWLRTQWQIDAGDEAVAWDIPAGKVLKLTDQKFLLVINAEHVSSLLEQLKDQLYQQDLWSTLDIQAGVAYLSESAVNQYVPQMLNLQCLDAISFDKGCYAGQEMVARMKYLGKNKRAAFILSGHASGIPDHGQDVQLAVGENWRRGGTLINVAGNAEKLHAIAVLPNDLAADAQLRIKDDADSALTIIPLPYPLAAD